LGDVIFTVTLRATFRLAWVWLAGGSKAAAQSASATARILVLT
jgi:hypothetical protein